MHIAPESKLMDSLFDPIKNAIFEASRDRLLMTKNYELLETESGKNLLDSRLFDPKVLYTLFDGLYHKEDHFYPADVEIGLNNFTTRLYAMRHFLDRKSGSLEDSKILIYGVKALSVALSRLDAHVVRLEFCPVRLLLDTSWLTSKKLSTMQVKTVLYRFCQQREISKQDLLEAIEESKGHLGIADPSSQVFK